MLYPQLVHDTPQNRHPEKYTVSVCLSVCLMLVLCLNEWTHRCNFLTLWQVHHSNFIGPICSYKISREPGKGSLETFFSNGGWDFFWQIWPFISERVRDRPMHGTQTGSHAWPIDRPELEIETIVQKSVDAMN